MQRFWPILIFLAITTSSCLKVKQQLSLNSNLSGTLYSITTCKSLQGVKDMMLMLQGGADPQMQKMMKSQIQGQVDAYVRNMVPDETTLRSALPEGVKLLKYEVTRGENNFQIATKFSFSHISQLRDLQKALAGTQQEQQDGSEMQIKEQGEYLIISQELSTVGSVDQVRQVPPQMMEQLLEGGGVYYRIRLPYKRYELVEHSAHKYANKKHALYWAYSLNKLLKLQQRGKAPRVYVKLKKK